MILRRDAFAQRSHALSPVWATRVESLRRFVVHPSLAQTWRLSAPLMPAGRLTCDKVSAGYQHRQQRHQASPLPVAPGLDGRTDRRVAVYLGAQPSRNLARDIGKTGRKEAPGTGTVV